LLPDAGPLPHTSQRLAIRGSSQTNKNDHGIVSHKGRPFKRKHLEQITSCDGKLFADFLVAGTFFLRKYRSVINDLNVFPVPDGDTGTNMFFTVRAAMVEARKEHSNALKDVAAAAAQGSLMGARGNSGVIISQMFRGFAHEVRHRDAINTLEFASALNEGVQAARKALLKPVEGTILSVASGAANACFKKAAGEKDFYAVLHATVDAANEALEKTPEQLAILKEAKVVDAGGQGFVYFMEGVLRMLPGRAPYTTAFPRNPVRRTTFTAKQKVETHRFCTEFVLAKTATEPDSLRALLTPHELGDVSRLKIDNMEEQHNVLVVDRESKPRGIVAVAPGEGFAKIFKELGADVVVIGGATMNPSVKDLLVAVNKVLAPVVYLMPNDKNIMLAAKEVDALTDKRVVVVPARTVADGVAALFALVNRPDDPNVTADEVLAESLVVGSGSIFRAGRDAEIGGVAVERNQLVGALEARNGSAERLVEGADATAIALAMVRAATDADPSLITLYYGHARRRNEAEGLAAALKARFPTASVEAYYGGQPTSDYVVSIER
jgi:dihydroxyacetone kinase-like predicted kinase